MKLSKSKLALAKVINENGGWVDDSANWAAQPKHGGGDVWFSTSDSKPYSPRGCGGFTFTGYGVWLGVVVKFDKILGGWHQAVLSREEYYQAYPEVTEQDVVDLAEAINMIDGGDNPNADAYGWIEWGGGDNPLNDGSLVDLKFSSGNEKCSLLAGAFRWSHSDYLPNIIAYRLHKPEVNPDLCESVARSIPEPEANEKLSPEATEDAKVALMSESIEESKRKPTIEQLAQDYRNAKDYADRLKGEATDAMLKAESIRIEAMKRIFELTESLK